MRQKASTNLSQNLGQLLLSDSAYLQVCKKSPRNGENGKQICARGEDLGRSPRSAAMARGKAIVREQLGLGRFRLGRIEN